MAGMAVNRAMADFLKEIAFFAGLPRADLDALLAAGDVRGLRKGERLFTQGDEADRFFAVVSGWVKLFRHTPEGEEAVAAVFGRGDVFGEAALFSHGHYPASAEAAEDVQVIAFTHEALKARAEANPEIVSRMLQSLSREIVDLQRQGGQMAIMTAPQRVACLLLQMASSVPGDGGTLRFPYDKALAAAKLGIKPETFSRALGQLKDIGVTTSGAEIHVEDFARLAHYTCSHCAAQPGECKGSRARGKKTGG
jgi:CRP/FNR family transcriptional regulator, dissimilatory nitrate respiration regulator